LKTSKAGQDDMISGEAVYPILGETFKQTDEHALAKANQKPKPKFQRCQSIKKLRSGIGLHYIEKSRVI
jgi:hypothetical protein